MRVHPCGAAVAAAILCAACGGEAPGFDAQRRRLLVPLFGRNRLELLPL